MKKLLLALVLLGCTSTTAPPCVAVAYWFYDYLLAASVEDLRWCKEIAREDTRAKGVTMRTYICECEA